MTYSQRRFRYHHMNHAALVFLSPFVDALAYRNNTYPCLFSRQTLSIGIHAISNIKIKME